MENGRDLFAAKGWFCSNFSAPSVPYLHEFAQVASWTILMPANLSSPLACNEA
jgi:hypothetical protein